MRLEPRFGRTLAVVALALVPGLAAAQSSTNYRISDHAFNNGGGPDGPASPNYQMKLHAIGDGVAATQLGSASFLVQGSFVPAYRPPGEVQGLDFSNNITLVWDPEPSVGDYLVYRSDPTLLSTGDTGYCLASGLQESLVYEPFDPDPGTAWFYLVTARNRLDEEGTKGYRSNGSERPNPGPCF